METKPVTSAAELIALAQDPNVAVRATGDLLYEALDMLTDAADDAIKAGAPSEILSAYRRARNVFSVLAWCDTDGSKQAQRIQGIMRGHVEAEAFSDAAAELMIYRVLAPQSLLDTVNALVRATQP